MSEAPKARYAMAFVDGRNLFQHAKAAFGHYHPNYDPIKLHAAVCDAEGWMPNLVRFYTGVPDPKRAPMWAAYWNNRVLAMKRAGVFVTTRRLRYREKRILKDDGTEELVVTPQEKGIDVRLALDLVHLARLKNYDVAVIYSQDQDLAEVVHEIGSIAKEQQRYIEIACAFPAGPKATAQRGIDRTKWIRMDEDFYNACLDPRDYRPKS